MYKHFGTGQHLSYYHPGTFNMDTPWLYIYTAHRLSQHQHHTLQLTSELTANKWLIIRGLMLEGFYRDRGREKEARLELYTPAATYIQVRRGDERLYLYQENLNLL